ncbi:MAG: hypothetical protein Sylvanvirus2_24 [Sylvanvirus sp.]|uniref:Uncharacterized protein n=1 Tax=Sylvanvirus sp. TaxID=2487774 RepID=A0A3G5AHB5_9VIRU|nr:MAG: hypothetical protein Sylvanvirus2_24 [Sylvanvirus sp.]
MHGNPLLKVNQRFNLPTVVHNSSFQNCDEKSPMIFKNLLNVSEVWNSSKLYPIPLNVSGSTLEIIDSIRVEESSWNSFIKKLSVHKHNKEFWDSVIKANEGRSPLSPEYDLRFTNISTLKWGKYNQRLILFRWIKGKYVDEGWIWNDEYPLFACEFLNMGSCDHEDE